MRAWRVYLVILLPQLIAGHWTIGSPHQHLYKGPPLQGFVE
jgi:hypothetical protein